MPHDLNDAAPTSLSHIVGQQGVTSQLRVALDAAFEDHRRKDDCLLVGPPGLGKSQIASVLGHELAVKTHEALGQSIKSASDLNALLLGAKDKEVVFIDEVHELPKIFQTALYLALDKRQIVVRGGKSFQSIPLPVVGEVGIHVFTGAEERKRGQNDFYPNAGRKKTQGAQKVPSFCSYLCDLCALLRPPAWRRLHDFEFP
jgi:Holliday junction resolvasome RuvABC ATP-dependent DNA helicase subunit